MRRRLLALCGCILLVLVGIGVVHYVTSPHVQAYSVDAVLAGLRQHPRVWAGRTVYVRGWIIGAGFGGSCSSANVAVCRLLWMRVAEAPAIAGQRPSSYNPSTQLQIRATGTIQTFQDRFEPFAGVARTILRYVPPIIALPFFRLFGGDGSQILHVRLASHCPRWPAMLWYMDGTLLPR